MLTKTDYARLAPYEQTLQGARDGYLRYPGRVADGIFHDVYKNITGADFGRTDACGKCAFDLAAFLARHYFDFKAAKTAAKPKTKKTPVKTAKAAETAV